MQDRGIKRFVLRCLVALLPVLLLVAFYIVRDPFHVVKPYSGQQYSPGDSVALTTNWGFVTVESFKHFNPQEHYNSFIFGSSLSGYYRIQDWQRHLPEGARPFHFNASRETLQGMLNKIYYLARNDVPLKNVLIVMEDEMLMRQPLDNDVLFVQHPQTAREVSWWKFHQLFFNAYRRPEIVAYLIAPGAMTQHVLEKGYATTDIPDRIENINEGYYRWADSVIVANPDDFFTPEHIAKYQRPLKELPCKDKITPDVERMLREMADALKKLGSDYQIIIPPHYGYEAIASNDLYMLESIFGEDRVHDYSHDPKLGSNLHYYYDDGHLIAAECARLMDSAYHAVTLPSPFLKH
ncbi:MAG: hypothetical protein IKX18_01325 [Muribaculaceae bacterium]|nr:hypothetical protein [Muribaculaceae bacterium]